MARTDLWTARPGSCSGQSSASSRRPAAAYRRWSSASLAPASASGRSLASSQERKQFSATALKGLEKCRAERRGEGLGVKKQKQNITKNKKKRKRGKTWQLSQRCCLFSPHIPQGGLLCCVHCAVPAVVFTNSPQQNLPMGCPGLAKLPNSISFLWESDGLASWYSEETEGEGGEGREGGRGGGDGDEAKTWRDGRREEGSAKNCNNHQRDKTHRCRPPPPPCLWRHGSSAGRWRTEPTWEETHRLLGD